MNCGTCTFPGCQRDPYSHGLCQAHDTQRRRGKGLSPLALRAGAVEERFWRHVDKRGNDECWPWSGCRNQKGYGRMSARGTGGVLVHRVSYELHGGKVPAGMMILHRCDNPPCVNPAHLRLGTAADNTADMIAKGRQKFKRSLSDDAIQEIRALYAAGGVTQTELGKKYGIRQALVSRYVSHRNRRPCQST